jgi:hypothetical protein
VPVDHLAVPRRKPKQEDEDGQAEQADSTIFTSVIRSFIACHSANNDHRNDECCASWNPELLGNEAVESHTGVVPHPVHGLGDDSDRNMPEDDAENDAEP